MDIIKLVNRTMKWEKKYWP